MGELLQDLRYTLRGLRRSPGFTLVAVATIALGIGVNSTMFSLVNAVLLRPLPVERPAELVNVYGHTATSASHDSNSYPNFLDYRAQATTLAGLAAYANFMANLSIDGSSELIVGELVSEDYFAVLGVRPALGRAFAAEEFTAPGAGPVVLLSHTYWQSRFGGDANVLGRTLRMNGVTYTVVGVAPAGFGGMLRGVTSPLWIPLSMVDDVEPMGNLRGQTAGDASRLEQRGAHFVWLTGRLQPGASVAQARAELTTIAAGLAAAYPETNALERLRVMATNDVRINPDLDGMLAPAAAVLLGAVGLVLLVACANLANMMLARASSRRREIAVRLSLGATRGRLMRQLLVESVTLALAGGVAALALAHWLAGVIARLRPPLPIDIGLDIAPDGRVLLFTLAVAAATGIVFGLAPALRATRPELVPALKDAGRRASGRGGRFELRDALVVAQFAVSLVLLVAGSLLVRSLGAAAEVDLGYDADRTAVLALALDMNGYAPEQAAVLIEHGRLRLAALPEVEAVGLIAGRGIEAADRAEGRRVAVVTRSAATRFWPDVDAVGSEFRTSWDDRPYTVVGVVEDYKVDSPGERPTSYIHLPLPQRGTSANFVVRTHVPAAGVVPLLERELRALDPELVFLETGTLRRHVDVRLFPVRAGAWLIGAFGGLALVLAAVGLYGVISYSVGRRTREIGIRKALGASSSGVAGMVLRQGMVLVGVGGGIGVVLAALAGRLLAGVLYVGALDAVSFAAAFAVLGGVAVLANWIPARRAAAVPPMSVLRSQ